MLPDGPEIQLEDEDSTVFFLNQTLSNKTTPIVGDTSAGESGILYVLNLVRTKRDKALRK